MSRKQISKIFLSSIHENAGKTTVSLGLYYALKKRKYKTAFMKPVGQEVVSVGGRKIDKDSYLIGKVFQHGRNLKDMSPITIGRGFTQKYIFNPQKNKLRKTIERSFQKLIKGKDAIIIEGTGHAGVGSVIDFSNADVASLLGAKVIIISEGGIGKSIDEIILNKALFDLKSVKVIGVIINKVLPDKYRRIKRTLGRGLRNKGLKLLGVIPQDPLMSSPTIAQIKERIGLQLLCGKAGTKKRVRHTIVAAMEPHNMIQYLQQSTLVLISGDRVDNILAAVSSHLVSGTESGLHVSGIILTGGLMPNPKIVALLKRSQISVLLTDDDTYTCAAKVEHLIPKILKTDKDKIKEAAYLVNKYIDVDKILGYF